jgi:hypothetical protein
VYLDIKKESKLAKRKIRLYSYEWKKNNPEKHVVRTYKTIEKIDCHTDKFLTKEQKENLDELKNSFTLSRTLLKEKNGNITLCFNCDKPLSLQNKTLKTLIESINSKACDKISQENSPIKWIHIGPNEISLYIREKEWFYPMTLAIFLRSFFDYFSWTTSTFLLFFSA